MQRQRSSQGKKCKERASCRYLQLRWSHNRKPNRLIRNDTRPSSRVQQGCGIQDWPRKINSISLHQQESTRKKKKITVAKPNCKISRNGFNWEKIRPGKQFFNSNKEHWRWSVKMERYSWLWLGWLSIRKISVNDPPPKWTYNFNQMTKSTWMFWGVR